LQLREHAGGGEQQHGRAEGRGEHAAALAAAAVEHRLDRLGDLRAHQVGDLCRDLRAGGVRVAGGDADELGGDDQEGGERQDGV
jgi:hypothetical protein